LVCLLAASCAPKLVPAPAVALPPAPPPVWGQADRSLRTQGLTAVTFTESAGRWPAASFFVNADLSARPSPCGVHCKVPFERVLFDMRQGWRPRTTTQVAAELAEGKEPSGATELEFVLRRGSVRFTLKLNADGGLGAKVLFPAEAEQDEQPVAGQRCTTAADFSAAVQAITGVRPAGVGLIEYSDWDYQPRSDMSLNSPPVITLFAVPLDKKGEPLGAGVGTQLAWGASFVLQDRTLRGGLVVLRRQGSMAPPWLTGPGQTSR
jgi:hypothetical protein